MTVQIYRFGATALDGNASMKDILGGKGANLAEMAGLKIPVPPGFTIPCSASIAYQIEAASSNPNAFVKNVVNLLQQGMEFIEKEMGFLPLVSVRSGARVSMPGMMDTILNVGLTSKTLAQWEKRIGKRAALDSYRRLIQMYSSVALGVDHDVFEHLLSELKAEVGAKVDSDLTETHLGWLVNRYIDKLHAMDVDFPDTFEEQLKGATLAVFKSWNNPRAIEYRKINGIPNDWGTAVTVQSMVFGNLNDKSCTGVIFTRDPSTGDKAPKGEFLINAQGEDVVAGIRTPEDAEKMFDWNEKIALQLVTVMGQLEDHYKDMQDIEFTVQDGKLYLLQTRNAKRSALAAFQVAYDLMQEGRITHEEALSRVNGEQLFSVMKDTIDPKFKTKPTFTGIAAGGGIVTGVAVLSSNDAVNCKQPCILVAKETTPDDIAGMNASLGILTATGGLTSHAAVVARGMNKTCVVGATGMQQMGDCFVLPELVAGPTIKHGTKITIDGSTGKVWVGVDVPLIPGSVPKPARELLMKTLIGKPQRLDPEVYTLSKLFDAIVAFEGNSLYLDMHLMVDYYVSSLGEAVEKCKAKHVVLDFDGTAKTPTDKVFEYMFPAQNNLGTVVPQLQEWSKKAIAKCSVRVPPNMTATSNLGVTTLSKVGFKFIKEVETIADMLAGGNALTIDPKKIETLFGTEDAFKTICAMLKEKGIDNFKSVDSPVYWYDALVAKGE